MLRSVIRPQKINKKPCFAYNARFRFESDSTADNFNRPVRSRCVSIRRRFDSRVAHSSYLSRGHSGRESFLFVRSSARGRPGRCRWWPVTGNFADACRRECERAERPPAPPPPTHTHTTIPPEVRSLEFRESHPAAPCLIRYIPSSRSLSLCTVSLAFRRRSIKTFKPFTYFPITEGHAKPTDPGFPRNRPAIASAADEKIRRGGGGENPLFRKDFPPIIVAKKNSEY